jgi:1-pyrroline-5-carboxylate dehydrogenase
LFTNIDYYFIFSKVTLKVDQKVAIVMEQMLRLLHCCGLPLTDVDLIHCEGEVMHQLLLEGKPRMTQFTGSSKVAEILAKDLHGRIKIEDAGWDWKILGPDVSDIDYVAFTSDQDAYGHFIYIFVALLCIQLVVLTTYLT